MHSVTFYKLVSKFLGEVNAILQAQYNEKITTVAASAQVKALVEQLLIDLAG